MSILEVLIAFTVLMGGLLGFARALVSTMGASTTSHEATLGREAARRMLEDLRSQAFAEVFVRFNDDPQDDPGGVGTAPGKNFAVDGLTAWSGDPDGLAGEILFPVNVATPGVLREDVNLPRLGMPRDLTGEGVIDAADHSGDYLLLPVVVRVEWRSAAGRGRVELRTMLGDLQ